MGVSRSFPTFTCPEPWNDPRFMETQFLTITIPESQCAPRDQERVVDCTIGGAVQLVWARLPWKNLRFCEHVFLI
jgi:hypothetical protein